MERKKWVLIVRGQDSSFAFAAQELEGNFFAFKKVGSCLFNSSSSSVLMSTFEGSEFSDHCHGGS